MTLPASIPVRRDGDAVGFVFLNGEGPGLVLVALFLVSVAWLVWRAWQGRRAGAAGVRPAGPGGLGRLFAPPAHHGPRVVHSARLTPKHSVHEVQWQGRCFLLACAETDVRLLAELPTAAVDATPGDPP